MEPEFLKSLVIVFGISAVVILILNRLNVPSLVGFLIAGAIVGPYGVGLVKDTHLIEILAEIGVILLLFTIGIEFSLKKLLAMRRALLGGGLQVLLTVLLSSALSYLVTYDIRKSVFIGFLVALSSTAIILKMLADRGETDTPHGRMMVGILIFQDLCVVPMMLLVPLLAEMDVKAMDILTRIFKAVFIVSAVLVGARWVIPYLLNQIVKTRMRELFIITIILLIFSIAFITSGAGLSLALGAFLAGLAISESEYSYQAISDILPLKEIFMALFLVSIGMLFNMQYLINNPFRIVLVVFAVLAIKLLTGSLSVLLNNYPLRVGIHTGVGLAQIGEFSFVLALSGRTAGLIGDELYQVFLSASVITMFFTPFALKYASPISSWLSSLKILKWLDRADRDYPMKASSVRKEDHVILIGFGLNGRNLARVLRSAEIPYVVLELNSETVNTMKKKGEPIYYGDGASAEILHKMGIKKARMLVIAISDPVATRRIVSIAKMENPDIYIIVRTRYLSEVEELKRLGAEEVIPEEFETSIEIFSRVLSNYGVPRNQIEGYIAAIRADNYSVLRLPEVSRRLFREKMEILKDLETETYLIDRDSPLAGHSIKELNLRERTGATIIAIKRGEEVIQNPAPSVELREGDILWLIGTREHINRAIEYLRSDSFLVEKYH
ncbi:MAG TPA: hypothetical protein ENK09_05420 [Nitrospirae bacterium]|nr:hypothetical protein [Nitrospirota bacterium]